MKHRNEDSVRMRRDSSLYRLLPFLVIVLLANIAHAQSGDIDDILKSIDPGDRKAVNEDFLNETDDSSFKSIDTDLLEEGDGSSFDPMDELDTIPRFRIEKEMAEKENEIIEAKNYDARMESECWCVFNPCLVLEAKLRDDLSAEAKRLAERRADAYDERANTKKTICRRWKEQGESSAIALYRQLEELKFQRAEERTIEEQLKRQRIVDERRRRESQIAAEQAEIAADKAEREQLRQEAAAKHQEFEARKLVGCQAAWDEGRNPCGCGHLSRAPDWVQNASTCEK